MPRESMLYSCEDNLWVPLLGVWGAISYAPLLVRILSIQFIPTTHGLTSLEFDYGTPRYVGRIVELVKIWKEPHRADPHKSSDRVTHGYMIWRANRVKDAVHSLVNDLVSPTYPLLVMIPSEIELLKQEYKEDKRKMEREFERFQGELEDMKLSNECQKGEIQELTKDRNNLLEDFKRLCRRYKGLEDKMKGKVGHMSKKAKWTIDEKEALEEQRKKTDYWKGRTQEVKGKMVEDRQMWEHEYETATGKQS